MKKPAAIMDKPKTFLGVDWSTSTMRPGCQDFLKCPSRRGDGLHPHRAPILNGSSPKEKK